MIFMQNMNLSAIDLNLLVVFDAIARARSVTAAAEALALSQPAVSHALKRLRLLMRDPLFVRGRNGLVATPHARSAVPEVQAILAAVGRVLSKGMFDPGSSTRDYRLAGSDYAMMTLFPAVIETLRKQAPHSRISVANVDAATAFRMEAGEIDLAFYGVTAPPGPFDSRELFREHFIGLVCEAHPLARKVRRGRISIDDYLAYPHVLTTLPNASPSPVDALLAKLGRSRRVALVAPNFAANVAAVRGSDLLLTLPSRLASLPLCERLVKFKLPVAVPEYSYRMVWHRSLGSDPATSWLRKVVAEAAPACVAAQ